MEDVFEEWDIYAQEKKLKQRDIDFNFLINTSKLKIIAITGIRRSGKTSLLILLRQMLEKKNEKVRYVNLEDSRIKDKKEVLDEILAWFGDSGYLLLDEITSVDDWEGWLSRSHEMLKGKLKIIVSSSRKGLSIPSKPLRGRILPQELYPLSFNEFLKFNNIKFEKTTIGIGKTKRALDKHLIIGGFPEIVLIKNKTDKISISNSYFRDIIGLDVAEISRENISVVELFGKYIIDTSYFSASKCLNFFKTLGYKIGKQSILNLEKNSQDSYLFFFVPIFSYNIKDRAQYPRKSYLGDTGFMYSISGKKDMGRLFENSVFLELKRRLSQNQQINYWKNKEGIEADFVIREGLKVKEIIQVVYEFNDKKTKDREIKGLISCAKEFNIKKGTIITKDFEAFETVDEIKIEFIPLWKWLLK
jgi:uncharacterized protein